MVDTPPPHPAHLHSAVPDEWDMRKHPYHEYLRDIGKRDANEHSMIPPVQGKAICDECGTVASDFIISKCPYCVYEVCGLGNCLHYCIDTTICMYSKCDNPVTTTKYCSRRCVGKWLGKRYG